MHFFLPPWLRHGRPRAQTSIFSVDIQPHASRLASAGQDGAVKIWSLDVISRYAKPPKSPSDKNAPVNIEKPPKGALLATISSHSSAVNSVRWSPRGDFLASGGDDCVVLVYQLLPGAAGGFGQKGENWSVRKPLRAHQGDVTDVCWSPDGDRLASASVDNAIYIWAVRAERVLQKLDGHKGLVKGVAWDPVGRYLASQSDDRSVRIWRTSDWKTEKTISKSFDNAIYQENSMAFFLRLSWSPCGTQLLATNAYKKPGAHLAPMFSRQSGFEDQIEFVGHREPVVSSRFSPRLYRAHPKKVESLRKEYEAENKKNEGKKGYVKKRLPDRAPTYTCLALGSKDCGATIWQASGVRPFFDMAHMFSQDVIDLSWGSDGYTLVACSTDGTVMYLRFEEEELGVVLSQEETRSILTETWRAFGGGGDSTKPIPESVTQLRMEADISKDATAIVADGDADDGIEVVEGTILEPQEQSQNPAFSQAAQEKRSALPAPVVEAAEQVRQNGPTPPADPRIIARQAETRVRGGKRRITPMAVSSAGGATPLSSAKPPQSALRPEAVEISETIQPQASPFKRPRTSEIGKDPEVSLGSFARQAASARQANGTQLANGAILRRDMSAIANVIPPGAKPVSHAAHLYAPSIVGLSLMLLPEKGKGPARVRVISTDIPPTLLESKEYHGSGGGYVVTCSRGGDVQWRDYFPKSSPVTALAGVAAKYAVVGTADGMLCLYSALSGRRLAPPIAVDSAPYMLEAMCVGSEGAPSEVKEENAETERWYVLFVSRSALCSVFDVKAKKLVCARSAASLLAKPVDVEGQGNSDVLTGRAKFEREISHCRVTEHGEPILVLSDRHAFAYSRDFCSWLRVADDHSPNSDYSRTLPAPKNVGLLRSLQAGTGLKHRSVATLSGMGDLRRAAVESLSHLESLMESAIVLGSATDYRYYLTNYATRIAAAVSDDVENCVVRLRELCDHLLNSADPTTDIIILGMSSRELLKQAVLPVISANRQMQRFVAEYTESLKEIKRLSSS